jgi:hypothetical protein
METIDNDTGEVSQDSAASAPASDAVPAAVTQAFNSIFANADGSQDERDELEQEGLVTPDGNAPADEPATEQGELSQDDTATDEGRDSGEASKVQAKSGKGDKAPLDPYLRFVGQNSGLTDEQIDTAYAADPTFATATLTTLGQQYADLSRQYVTPGSPVAPGTQGGEQQPAQQPQQPTPGWDSFMSQLAAFSEANGEDMGKMAKLLNDEFVSPLRAMMAANAAREQDLARQEAAAGFETVRKSFGDFYGPENGQLSQGQIAARQQVGMMADQIRAGAKAQGRTVSIGEAISRAHAIVTHDMRQQAARRDLVAQVAKRSKAATVPPTQRKSRPTGERSDKAAEDAARTKMMEMGMDNF